MLELILLIIAGMCAIAVLFSISSKVNLLAVGLLCVVIALLVPKLG